MYSFVILTLTVFNLVLSVKCYPTKTDCIQLRDAFTKAGGMENFAVSMKLNVDAVYGLYRDCLLSNEGFRFKRSAAVLVPPLLIKSNQNFEREKLERVSEELGARITKMSHKYRSEGIRIESIKYFYHKEFHEPLDLHKLGFQSIEDLITDVLSAKYPIEIRDDSQGFKRLYSDLKEYYYWLSGIKVSKKFDLLDIMVDVPEDVITSGQQLPPFQFPDNIEFNDFPQILSGDILNHLKYSKVKVMTAISPHEMYLQICGDNYHNSYMEMKTKMRFYDKRENAHKYRIPCLLLFDGFLCAAKYPQMCNEWHRSRIISIDKQNNVTLELIDIGAIIVEKSSELRLLLKEFALLSPQAIKVQLTAIRPDGKSGHSWGQWAINFVKQLQIYSYWDKTECAFIDFRNDRFRVYIKYYDRLRSKNVNHLIFLHQILVDKQLALISGNDEVID